jgi:hypothetical protein
LLGQQVIDTAKDQLSPGEELANLACEEVSDSLGNDL